MSTPRASRTTKSPTTRPANVSRYSQRSTSWRPRVLLPPALPPPAESISRSCRTRTSGDWPSGLPATKATGSRSPRTTASNRLPTLRRFKVSGSPALCSKKTQTERARLDRATARGRIHRAMERTSRNGRGLRAASSIVALYEVVLVVFRTESGRTDRRHHAQELLERHLKVEKASLAENPTIIVEDFIRDHQRQPRQTGDDREPTRRIQMRHALVTGAGNPVDNDARLSQGDYVGAAKH